ncbi:MAG: hypothetical protein RR382_07135 [Tannerellaceae bacterium]
MNKAAEIIVEDILGESFRTVVLNNKAYSIKPLTYKTISRVVKYLAKIDMKQEYTSLSIISEIPENGELIIKAIACAISENPLRTFFIERRLRKSTMPELKSAMEAIIDMIGGSDFFHIASLATNVAQTAARPK